MLHSINGDILYTSFMYPTMSCMYMYICTSHGRVDQLHVGTCNILSFVGLQVWKTLPASASLEKLVEGDKLGLLAAPDGSLSLFVNGKQTAIFQFQALARKHVVVDLFGKCDEVLLLPLIPVPPSPPPHSLSATGNNNSVNVHEPRRRRGKRAQMVPRSIPPTTRTSCVDCEHFQLCQRYLKLKLALPGALPASHLSSSSSSSTTSSRALL